MTSPSVLLIDDHAMFRSGLNLVIKVAMPAAQIHEAGSLQDAIANAPDWLDVVLLDINLRGLSGLEGIDLLHRRWPQVPILMLSAQSEPETVRQALARGAAGFVSKSETADHILQAIYKILQGTFEELRPAVAPNIAPHLTPRQCEVLDLLGQGLSNKVLARKLVLSDNTVRRHVQDILAFFNVSSRAEAVAAARQQRLIN
jgi:DNA-binding NarL/FixJ family response regulator